MDSGRIFACVSACDGIKPEKLPDLLKAVEVLLNVSSTMGTNLKGSTNQLRRAFENLRTS